MCQGKDTKTDDTPRRGAPPAIAAAAKERRSYGCFLLGLVVSLVLAAVVAGAAVALYLGAGDATLVLSVLLVVLVAAGVAACVFVEWQRRRAVRSRQRGAQDWVSPAAQMANGRSTAPSAPPPSDRSSLLPWRKTSSSQSSTPTAYHQVSRNEPI